MTKRNEHVMTWLAHLRLEGVCPDCATERRAEIMTTLFRYAFGTGSV